MLLVFSGLKTNRCIIPVSCLLQLPGYSRLGPRFLSGWVDSHQALRMRRSGLGTLRGMGAYLAYLGRWVGSFSWYGNSPSFPSHALSHITSHQRWTYPSRTKHYHAMRCMWLGTHRCVQRGTARADLTTDRLQSNPHVSIKLKWKLKTFLEVEFWDGWSRYYGM